MKVPKSLVIKAEQNYGLDVVDEVLDFVEKKSPQRAYDMYVEMELMDHARCVELLFVDDDGEFITNY